MRKLPIVLLVVALAAVPTVSALAKKKPPVRQTVEGTIALPQGNPAGGCVYRAQRTAYSMAGAGVNGILGHTFDVDPKTVNKPFKLEAGNGAGLDISFYADLGDITDPTTAPANVGFETAGPGGESGTVPEGFPIAFVCMAEGANSGFTYNAGKGVK